MWCLSRKTTQSQTSPHNLERTMTYNKYYSYLRCVVAADGLHRSPMSEKSSGVLPPARSQRHQSIVSQSSIAFPGFSSTSRSGPRYWGQPLTQSAWIYAAAPLFPFFINTWAVVLDILHTYHYSHQPTTLYLCHCIFRSLTEETPLPVLHMAMNCGP